MDIKKRTDETGGTPWYELVDFLVVTSKDEHGDTIDEAEFNFDTWEWVDTPGVRWEARYVC